MSSIWRVLFFHSYHLGRFRAEWPPSSSICGWARVRTGCAGLHSRIETWGLGWVRSQGPTKEAPAPCHLFRRSYFQSCSHWVIWRTLSKVGYLQGTCFFFIVMRPPIQIESFRIFFENSVLQSKIITTTLYLIKNQI